MTPVLSNTPPVPTSSVKPPAVPARAADGDYKTKSAATSQTKDSDGDYKAASRTAASTSSSDVLAALSNLKTGG